MTLWRRLRVWLANGSVTVSIARAICFTAIAVLLRWSLDPWLGPHLPLLTLYASVTAAAWVGGRWSGVLATVIGYVACDYLFIEPRGSFALDPGGIAGGVTHVIVCAALIAAVDATRRAQRRARERSEFLRTTLATLGDAVITTDTAGRITSMNRVAAALLATAQDDAVGRPIGELLRIVDELTREVVENPAAQCLRAEATMARANRTTLIARDGTERSIDNSASPIFDQRGRLVGSVLVFRDVTDRRQSERAIENTERKLSDLFENTAMAKPVDFTHLLQLLAELGHRTPRAAAHRLSHS